MGSLCVLGFILLNTLHHGLAQAPTARLTLKNNWSEIFWGEKVTFRCEIEGDTGWMYGWRTPSSDITTTTQNEFSIIGATQSDNGEYRCYGRKDPPQVHTDSQWSNPVILTVKLYKPRTELRADRNNIPPGGAVTLSCSMNPPSPGWKFHWYRAERTSVLQITQDAHYSATQGGPYWCRGERGDPPYYTENSSAITINNILSDRAVVTRDPEWSEMYSGETITLRCVIQRGGVTKWEYEWETTGSEAFPEHSEAAAVSAVVHSGGEYRCKGKPQTDSFSSTDWSAPITVTVTAHKPKAELTADKNSIPAWGAVILNCNVDPPSSGWKFHWYRGERTPEIQTTQYARYSVTQGGPYWCRGSRGDPPYYTENSNQVHINRMLSDRAVVTRDPEWSEMYSGEMITLRCVIQRGGVTKWEYEWETTGSNAFPEHSEAAAVRVAVYSGGEYRCKGKPQTDLYSSTEWSAPITVTVSAHKPKAELTTDNTDVPEGGSVTLTCSVNPSSGWKYTFWYKQDESASFKAVEGSGVTSAGQIQVSEEGLYVCRGERGNPLHYTESSDEISINKKNANRAVLTLRPDWSEIYYGEKMTLRCEVEGVDDNEWDYEWETTSSSSWKPEKEKEFSIKIAYTSHSGDYKCRGRKKSDKSSTVWSNPITLTVLPNKPKPVLNVSSSWLSPGGSVTLSCEVKNPSAGWRFFWYKTVPKLPGDSYSYELLSGSSHGTEQNSFIVHGHTAGYVCRAGRGDPVFHSEYSAPKFVWSADFPSSASLRVSPDRVQHFTSDSVTLSCEGNSSQWRVMRFLKESTVTGCSTFWTKTKSSCTIPTYRSSNDVFWCESESGEFSNAVNITKQSNDIILESPVHPVPEGSPVSLRCRLGSSDFVSNIFFYHNDKLIQNDTRRELNISAVSTSDEGFYKCQHSGGDSAQSWMSVRVSKPGSSSSPLILCLVGLICGVILLVLLLLLYRYRQAMDRCCSRSMKSKNRDQNSATNHGDVTLYESVKDRGESTNGADAGQSQDVTYSLIEMKNFGKKGKKSESNESPVYSEVKMNTADDSVTYAQVSCLNTGKDKKKKGKSKAAPTEDPVYSEVKPGTTSGQ